MNPFAPSSHFTPEIATQASEGIASPEDHPGPAWWFAFQNDGASFRKNRLLIHQTDSALSIPQAKSLNELGLTPIRQQFLGWLSEQPCYSAELEPGSKLPAGYALEQLRGLYGQLDAELFAIAGRAVQIVAWDRHHQYCGHCATAMEQSPTERTKRCPSCGLRNYPKLSPAVIMLVYRGEEVLLARSPRFRKGMYSVLAGFVEPGESLEETVAREVMEEVGITVKNIRYFGSQPWPFPDSLMLGFTAEYASGDIVMEPGEIEAADWFTKDNLPPVPGPLSIARKLIDSFVAGEMS